MASFLQAFREAASELALKISSLYRGESYSALQTAVGLNIKPTKPNSINLKHHQYPELNRFFIKFFNSASTAGRVNGENIALLVGPEGAGKSSYVEENLETFRKMKADLRGKVPQVHRNKSPEYFQDETKQKIFDNEYYLMFRYDFANRPALNLEGFINLIEEDMMGQIMSLNDRIRGGYLCKETIRQVVTAQNAEKYIFVYLKDVIYCLIHGTDPIEVASEEGRQELRQFNQTINQQQFGAQQFFQQKYGPLVDILAKHINKSPTQTALRLFLSVAKRIQYEHRPQTHPYSWHQTGLESINYLFDILNYLCGLGALNKRLFEHHFFNDKNSINGGAGVVPVKESNGWVKSGNRVDVGLILLNLDHLYFYGTPQFWGIIDHLIARTAHDRGLRTHFPIMIQLPSSADLQQIHDMGQFSPACPVIVELPGFTHHSFRLGNSSVSHLFTYKVITRLFWKLGRVPAVWSKAVEEMAKGRATVESIIKGKAPYLKREKIKIEAQFNSIFTQSQVAESIYGKDTHFELVQHLRLLGKAQGLMVLDRPGYYIDFATRPLFQALLRSNLVYMHYYLPYVDVVNLPHAGTLREMKLGLWRENRIGWLWWRWSNRRRFNIYRREIRMDVIMERERYHYDRFFNRRSQAHLAETYYGARYNYIMLYYENGYQQKIAGE